MKKLFFVLVLAVVCSFSVNAQIEQIEKVPFEVKNFEKFSAKVSFSLVKEKEGFVLIGNVKGEPWDRIEIRVKGLEQYFRPEINGELVEEIVFPTLQKGMVIVIEYHKDPLVRCMCPENDPEFIWQYVVK